MRSAFSLVYSQTCCVPFGKENNCFWHYLTDLIQVGHNYSADQISLDHLNFQAGLQHMETWWLIANRYTTQISTPPPPQFSFYASLKLLQIYNCVKVKKHSNNVITTGRKLLVAVAEKLSLLKYCLSIQKSTYICFDQQRIGFQILI